MTVHFATFKSANVRTENTTKNENINTYSSSEITSKEDVVELSKKKTKKARSFWGSIWASMVGSTVLGLQSLCGIPIMKKLPKLSSFVDGDAKIVEDALKQAVVDSGLKEKGVRLRFLNPSKLTGKMPEETFIQLAETMSSKPIRAVWELMNLDLIRKGQNAAFINKDVKFTTATLEDILAPMLKGDKETVKKLLKDEKVFIKKNSILASKGKTQGAIFHEIGYALNFNMSKIGKFLQKIRPLAMLAPTFLISYGAFTRKSKKKDDKELNGLQKTHNFVRDNAGILAFATTVPMLVEEGMATIKGQKLAKKLLKPEMAKKVLKGNAFAYLSYLSLAVFSALGAKAAVSVKDRAIDKKEIKLQLRAIKKDLKAEGKTKEEIKAQLRAEREELKAKQKAKQVS